MQTYTIHDIRELRPCYDPVTGQNSDGGSRRRGGFLPEDWRGTAVDILRVQDCPAEDRLWVVSHWLPDRTLRLFAVWCARNALALIESPDERNVRAVDVAERHANGQASDSELAAAWAAAWDAARDTAWDAARDAAWAPARAAAWDAARAAARDAAWAAAWDAAWAPARDVAWDAARAAARDAQIAHLIEMIETETEGATNG